MSLLERARAGDQHALTTLYDRYLPALRRWAHGRLPRWARDLRDTDDLVQDAVIQTLKHLDRFEPRRDGAFLAFLRKILQNRLLDEIRRVGRAPRGVLESDHADLGPSPLEEVIGRSAIEQYEAALATLAPEEREAVVARLELGCSYQEIAGLIGRPSPDAARMVVSRALVRLAREMRGDA